MVLTSAQEIVVDDPEDDIERELAFYNQALAAAKEGISRLLDAKVPWQRPLDYYAEMVKSDDHMRRVKQQLMVEHKSIAEAEERRKQRELKRYSKEVQAEKKKERTQMKKQAIDEVSKWRKTRAKEGYTPDGPEYNPDNMNVNIRQPKKVGERFDAKNHKKSQKRQYKENKYGHGGRKKLLKQNDSKSANDMSSFRVAVRGGVSKGGKKGGGGSSSKRPGKDARAKARGRK